MCRDNGDWERHQTRSNRDEITSVERRVRATWTAGERPHETIVAAIAAATGRSELTIEPLYDSIAVDALDALLTGAHDPDRSDVRISFFHDGVAIRIAGNGAVIVTKRRPERG